MLNMDHDCNSSLSAQARIAQRAARRWSERCIATRRCSDTRNTDAQVEQCGLTLAHQFPWVASSYVAVGLALRRRLLAPDTTSTAAKRKQISKVRSCEDAPSAGLMTMPSEMGLSVTDVQG